MAEQLQNVLPVKVILSGLKEGILGGSVLVNTTATAIPTSALSYRKSIILRNESGQLAYLGASNVTNAGANGFPFKNGEVLAIDLDDRVDIYCVLSAGSGLIYYLEAA